MIFLCKLGPLILTAVTLCIDPGHGGSSTGAVGEYALEKDVVLEIGILLQNWLNQVPGITRAALTRDGDYDVSLQARTDYANAGGFDLFVSIHENAFNGTVQGTETFCGSLDPSDVSYQMAVLLQQGIIDAYGYTDRGVKNGGYLHVIRETFMPAILGEGSFLDYDLNWNESYLYAFNVEDHTGVQAWAYADALCSFWGFPAPDYGNGVILMDNCSAGFSLNDSTLWQFDSAGAPWMGGCLLGSGGDEGIARWTAPVQLTGTYTLHVWWTSGSDRSSSVCFRVSHSGGSTDVYMDQYSTGGGEWVTAGSFSFDGSCIVDVLCSESSPGAVVADALRLTPPMGVEEGPLQEITVLENPSSSFTLVFPGSASRTVEILDLSGRVVDEVSGTGTVTWVPGNLPSGVYFAAAADPELSVRLILLK